MQMEDSKSRPLSDRIRLKLQSHPKNKIVRTRTEGPTFEIQSRSRTGDIKYTCKMCSKLFSALSAFNKHRVNCDRERHTRDSEFKCPEIGCGKVFLRFPTLNEHKNTHRSLNLHSDKYSKMSYQNKNSRNFSHVQYPNEFSLKKNPNEFSHKQYRNNFFPKENLRDFPNRPTFPKDFRQKQIVRNFSQAKEQFSRPWNAHPKTYPRDKNQYRQNYAREFSQSVNRYHDFNRNKKQEKYLLQKRSSPDQYLNASRDVVQIPNFEEYRSMLNNQKYKSRSSTNLNSKLKSSTSDTCEERKPDFNKTFEEHLPNPMEEKNPKMVVDLEEIIVDSEDGEMEDTDTEEILDLEETAAAISRELEELRWFDGEVLDEYKEKNMNTLNNLHCQSNAVDTVIEKEREGNNMSDIGKDNDLEEGEIIDSDDEEMGEKEALSEKSLESPDDIDKIIKGHKNMLNNKKYEYKETNKPTSSPEKSPNKDNLKKTSNLIFIPYKCDHCKERKSDFQSFQEHLMSHLEENRPKKQVHFEKGGKVDSEDNKMDETEVESENEEMDGKESECSIEKYQPQQIPSLFCLSLIRAYADDSSPTSDSLSENVPQNDSSSNDSSSNDFANVSPSNESSPATDSMTSCLTSSSCGDESAQLIGPGLSLIQAYASPIYSLSPNYSGNVSQPNDSSSSTELSCELVYEKKAEFVSEKKDNDKDETDESTNVDSVDTEEIPDREAIATREIEKLNWLAKKTLDEYKAKNTNTLGNLHCLSREVVEREKMLQKDISLEKTSLNKDKKKELLENKMQKLKSELKEKNLNILSGLQTHNKEMIDGMGDNIPVDVKTDVTENNATPKPDSIVNMETEYVEEQPWTLLESIVIPKCDFIELDNIETPKRDFVENIEWSKWNFSPSIGPLKWDLIEYIDVPKSDVIEDTVALTEITPVMEKIIQKALKSRKKVLIDRHNIRIGARDIRNLAGLNWLNDEIINFYLQMIVDRGVEHGVKIHAYSTFFYPKLMSGGHTSLRRWTKNVDIFAQDLLLIPIHLGIHWSLAVVDLAKSGVFYYDSMGGDNPDCLAAILAYLQEEHRIKKEAELDVSNFKARTVEGVPQQMNGSDCGVFLLKFAEYLSRGADLNFTQKDMPTFRKIIIWEILNDQLLQ